MHEDTGTRCLTREDEDRLLLSVTRAGQILGISRRQMYRVLDGEVEFRDQYGGAIPAVDVPRIEEVNIGSRRLIVRKSLDEFVNWLRAQTPDPSPIPPPQPPGPGPRPPTRPGTPKPPKSNP